MPDIDYAIHTSDTTIHASIHGVHILLVCACTKVLLHLLSAWTERGKPCASAYNYSLRLVNVPLQLHVYYDQEADKFNGDRSKLRYIDGNV